MNRPQSLTRLNEKISLLSTKIPFSYYGIIKRELGRNSQTILDVGCGNGAFMYVFNRDKKYKITGIDVYEPYIKEARQLGIYEQVIKDDVRNISFPDKTLDVVISNHVVEHLKKEEGFNFLDKLEKIAKRKVIIITPIGFFHQDEYDKNPYQKHLSAWFPEDFLKRGYRVIGQGWNIFHYNKFLKKICDNIGQFNNIFFIISILLQPFLAKRFKYCFQMICIKKMNKK